MRPILRTALTVLVAMSSMPAIAQTHDFDGDGHDDVTWRNVATGADVQWPSAKLSRSVALTGVGDLRWRIVGTGDFDGDGGADLLWRNMADGRNVIWRGANSTMPMAVATVADLRWRVVGIGDFDGDHRADILWSHPTYGHTIWPAANVSAAHGMPRLNLVAIADVTGDGRDDLVGRTTDYTNFTIRFFAWPNANAAHERELAVVPVFSGIENFTMLAVGDFDGDGRDDLFWRALGDGRDMYWPGGNPRAPRPLVWVRDVAWIVVAAGDYDGDGKSDLFWRHRLRGDASVWPDADGTRAHMDHVAATWSVAP